MDLHGDLVNHILLIFSFVEHCLEGELAVLELLKRDLIIIEFLNSLRLPVITRFHLRNGIHKCSQVHQFASDPVSNMDEWVNPFASECIELSFETRLIVGGDHSQRLLILGYGLLVSLLVMI